VRVNTDLDVVEEINVDKAQRNFNHSILIETQFPQIPAKTPDKQQL
jgi:hypothetical protein